MGFGDGERFLLPADQVPQPDPNAQAPTGPDPAVEQVKLELQKMKIEGDLQIKQQELTDAKEIAFAKMALEEKIKLSDIYERLGLEDKKVQTTRDVAALRETNRTGEMNIKQKMGSGI